MILDRMFMSLFEVTMKLPSVPPNELSRMEDHFGCSKVT
jgi:hypothetical protein